MARPASQQTAGYFPTPSTLLPSFASTLDLPLEGGNLLLLDPCAGQGEAVHTLRELWQQQHAGREDTCRLSIEITACEMERDRFRQLKERLSYDDVSFHTDAFRLLQIPLQDDHDADTGASVLFLNPPYDHDPEFGRLEQRFLHRFTQALAPGRGVLLFLLPVYALAVSAEHLARHFLDLRAWRLPDPHYQDFRQILLVARRASQPLPPNAMQSTLLDWARQPEQLPVLPERCPDPLPLDLCRPGELPLLIQPLDLTPALEAFQPPDPAPRGLPSVQELLRRQIHCALPPKPAHIALALASGLFNGCRLEPDDPSQDPPILAKGVFERRGHEVSQKLDQDGDLVGSIQVERPELRMTVLRLDDLSFHQLALGTTASGSDDLERWTVADLLIRYSRSLTQLLQSRFVPLHDPRERKLQLPELPRKPFRVQSTAIQAALKLMASGGNPFFVAEVGTGKSTMALSVAALLSPAYRDDIVRQLAVAGFETRHLPTVRRVLLVCPPHLIQSWQDQAAAVMPDARVQVLRSVSDLEQDAEIYLLSREAAKLGHGWQGIDGRCPRCGLVITTAAKKNVSRRLRCHHRTRRPLNCEAQLAQDLATALALYKPDAPLVSSLARGPALQRLLASRDLPAEGRSLEGPLPAVVDSIWKQIYRDFQQLVDDPQHDAEHLHRRFDLFADLAYATGHVQQALDLLRPHVKERAYDNFSYSLKQCVSELEHDEPPTAIAEQTATATNERAAAADSAPTNCLDLLLEALESLHALGQWHTEPRCNEPLFQAIPKPRRYPLARRILQKYRRRFDALVLDEVHEFATAGSAQQKAAHRLVGLPGVPTLVLTGSLMGGYASSLFANFWALSPRFRDEFQRHEMTAFLDRYGYRKLLVNPRRKTQATYGSVSDREVSGSLAGTARKLGEAPGVLPSFILQHLLPTGILVHKADLDAELPKLTETPVPLLPETAADHLLLAEYQRLEETLLQHIRRDRFDPLLAGRLLGALVELPTYLDRAARECGPFEITYPETCGGQPIALGQSMGNETLSPKERWLLEAVEQQHQRGRRCLVFLRHTGSQQLPQRLLRLLTRTGLKATYLDVQKVSAAKRETWIDRHAIGQQVDVLLVNPNAVRTGLNNLVTFSTAIWHQLDYSATTFRQANGRLHRIGQTEPVEVLLPYVAHTAQEVAFDLVARKVSASLQVDGLDLETALESAGAGEQDSSLASALAIGEAVYQALEQQYQERM